MRRWNTSNFRRLLHKYKRNAKANNREFELTDDECHVLFKASCHYCGGRPKKVMDERGRFPYFYNGIDRLVQSEGYSNANVVTACYVCNMAKGRLDYSEFMILVKKISQRHFLKGRR